MQRRLCAAIVSLEHESELLERVHRMPALRRFAHHGEGRVLVGFEAGQRIGEEGNFHGRFQNGECPDFSRKRGLPPMWDG